MSTTTSVLKAHYAHQALTIKLTLPLVVLATIQALPLSSYAKGWSARIESHREIEDGTNDKADNETTTIIFGDQDETITRSSRLKSKLSKKAKWASWFSNSRHSVKLAKRQKTDKGLVKRFQHYYDGLEVVGSELLASDQSRVRNRLVDIDLNTRPTVSINDASGIAQSIHNQNRLGFEPVLKVLPSTKTGEARLVWFIDIEGTKSIPGTDLFIDANTGEIVSQMPVAQTITPTFEVLSANANCEELDAKGRPLGFDYGACDWVVRKSKSTKSADIHAKTAASNAKKAYTYYKKRFGRNSFDNQGASLVSLVHVGYQFSNAFWNSQDQVMAYGDGDGVNLKNFTQSLDVSGHELTHGVISQTANLQYRDESGALNEALADYFGKRIANDGNWILGASLFIDQSQGKAIRDLQNPARLTTRWYSSFGTEYKKAYPTKMSEFFKSYWACDSDNDHCYVHSNSTIIGHFTYLLTNAIGSLDTETLLYNTLTQRLVATSDFSDFKSEVLGECKELFAATKCDSVRTTFAQVGL